MVYSEEYRIKCYEVDSQLNYKAFSFMNMAQEAAHIHSTISKFGYDDIVGMKCAWVLSRAHVKFIKAPKWEDVVKLNTWSKGLEGLFAIRDFEMVDNTTNEQLVLATTSWLMIDTESRKIKRIDHVFTEKNSNMYDDRSAIDKNCDKIKFEKDVEEIWSKVIRASDLDCNLHANNAKYLEWALDTLDYETVKNEQIDEFKIVFNHEAKYNDNVVMYRKQLSDKQYYIEGRCNSNNIFQITINFK